MEANVNREQAEKILMLALKNAQNKNYRIRSQFFHHINDILTSNHLTFRYILTTALLAKSTSPDVNILALQKGSKLPGAYDARTLCHKVLVPFEENYLGNALGGSNEPFMNKPARYTELSKTNPVRRGNDQRLLNLLCDFLPQIKDRPQAIDALTDSVFLLLKIANDSQTLRNSFKINSYTYKQCEDLVNDLLIQSFGGESLALATGGLLTLLLNEHPQDISINVHTVNQSGASSKEISDIDVYRKDTILYTIEVKDKMYSSKDVTHAVNKASKSKADRMMFITGPRGSLNDKQKNQADLIKEASEKGIYLSFYSYKEFTRMVLSLAILEDEQTFFNILFNIANNARMKRETILYLIEVSKSNGFID